MALIQQRKVTSNRTLRPLFTLRAHTAEVQAIAFQDLSKISHEYRSQYSHSPSLFLSGDIAGHIKLWNLKTRRVISPSSFKPHASKGVLELDWKSDTIMSQGREGSVVLWDVGDVTGNMREKSRFWNHSHGFCRAELLQTQYSDSLNFVAEGSRPPNHEEFVKAHDNGPDVTNSTVSQKSGETLDRNDVLCSQKATNSSAAWSNSISETIDSMVNVNNEAEEICKNPPNSSIPRFTANTASRSQPLVISPAMDGEVIVMWDPRANKMARRMATAVVGDGMCMALTSCMHTGRAYVYVGMECGKVGLFDIAQERLCGKISTHVLDCPILSLATRTLEYA